MLVKSKKIKKNHEKRKKTLEDGGKWWKMMKKLPKLIEIKWNIEGKLKEKKSEKLNFFVSIS